MTGGLAEHLREAIALNRARRAGYVAVAGARAAWVSRALVAAERSLVPAAITFDRAAAPFVRAGVPVVVADVVPMSEAAPADRPLRYDGSGGAAAVEAARRRLRTPGVPLLQLVDDLGDIEARHGAHLAMTIHVLESAALGLAHGERYAAMTYGATTGLTRRWVRGHLALVPAALRLDAAAHGAHRRGAGILVNDVPPIPLPPSG